MQSRKIIITVSGVILFLLAGTFTMLFRPSEQTPQPAAAPAPAVEAPAPAVVHDTPHETEKPSVPEVWYIYVTGAVKKPGVYKLPEGSRIFEAVNAAGGFTTKADEASLNLADFLSPNLHLHIAEKGQVQREESPQTVRVPGYSQQSSISGIAGSTGLVDINRANSQELQKINGVGPAIAQRIIDYRQKHGSFSRPEDLLNVKGIGASRLEQIRSQITLSGGGTTASRTGSDSTSLIDVNHANLQELQRISGVGKTTAQRIIDYRQKHGSFTKPEDLLNVKGIGAAKLSQIRTQIVIR